MGMMYQFLPKFIDFATWACQRSLGFARLNGTRMVPLVSCIGSFLMGPSTPAGAMRGPTTLCRYQPMF